MRGLRIRRGGKPIAEARIIVIGEPLTAEGCQLLRKRHNAQELHLRIIPYGSSGEPTPEEQEDLMQEVYVLLGRREYQKAAKVVIVAPDAFIQILWKETFISSAHRRLALDARETLTAGAPAEGNV